MCFFMSFNNASTSVVLGTLVSNILTIALSFSSYFNNSYSVSFFSGKSALIGIIPLPNSNFLSNFTGSFLAYSGGTPSSYCFRTGNFNSLLYFSIFFLCSTSIVETSSATLSNSPTNLPKPYSSLIFFISFMSVPKLCNSSVLSTIAEMALPIIAGIFLENKASATAPLLPKTALANSL